MPESALFIQPGPVSCTLWLEPPPQKFSSERQTLKGHEHVIKGHSISGNRRISHDAEGRHQAALLAARCILATFLLLDQARQAR